MLFLGRALPAGCGVRLRRTAARSQQEPKWPKPTTLRSLSQNGKPSRLCHILPTPNSEDAADPTEPSGWHKATTFFVDVIWGSLLPLLVIPSGALFLLAAKLRQRGHGQAGRK